jgi:hypothetical protein
MQLKALHEIEHTQGTVQLISRKYRAPSRETIQHALISSLDNSNLQQKNGLVLVPQPNQNDPNDPLVHEISSYSFNRRF